MSVVGGRTIERKSADPTTGAQDAGLQEPRISPTISLHPRIRLQHLQRPTPSDFSVDAPRLPCHGDGRLARRGRLRGLTARNLFAFLVQQRDKAIKTARRQMLAWAPHERQKLLSEESRKRFEKARKNSTQFDDVGTLRAALLDFIADFANWDNSTVSEYLETSRALTQAAHQALGGAPGTRPLVVDPFAGGGLIPLEALSNHNARHQHGS